MMFWSTSLLHALALVAVVAHSADVAYNQSQLAHLMSELEGNRECTLQLPTSLSEPTTKLHAIPDQDAFTFSWLPAWPQLRRQLLLRNHSAHIANHDSFARMFCACWTLARVAFFSGFKPQPGAAESSHLKRLVSKRGSGCRSGTEMELRRAIIELTLIAAYHHPSAKRPEFPKPCKSGPGSISQLAEVNLLWKIQQRMIAVQPKQAESIKPAQKLIDRCLSDSTRQQRRRRSKQQKLSKLQVVSHRTQKVAVKMGSVLDSEQQQHLLSLVECVKQTVPSAVHRRSFGEGNYGNGQIAVMLQLFLRHHLPTIWERIVRSASKAAEAAGWEPKIWVNRTRLGVRCIELLDYHQQDGLGWHRDDNTSFTMSIMLSTASEYNGGELQLYSPLYNDASVGNGTSCDIVSLGATAQGSAIIFPGAEVHRLTKITGGNRKVLVLEFWPYEDAMELMRSDPYNQVVQLAIKNKVSEKLSHLVANSNNGYQELKLSSAVKESARRGHSCEDEL